MRKGILNGKYWGGLGWNAVDITGSTYTTLADDHVVSIGSKNMTITMANFQTDETKWFLNDSTTYQTLATGGVGSFVLPGNSLGSTYTLGSAKTLQGFYYNGTNYYPLLWHPTNQAVAGTTGTFSGAVSGLSFTGTGSNSLGSITSTGWVKGTTGTFTGKIIHAGFGGTTRIRTGATYTTVGSDWIISCGSSSVMNVTLGSTTFLDGELRIIINDSSTGSNLTLTPGIGSIGGGGTALGATYTVGSHTKVHVVRIGNNFWV